MRILGRESSSCSSLVGKRFDSSFSFLGDLSLVFELCVDDERSEGQIDPNRSRSVTTLNAKIRLRFSRTREPHQLMKEDAEDPDIHLKSSQ